jgi:lysylphosphatidylglycerol synthetase-like protein (DUF2156 family)
MKDYRIPLRKVGWILIIVGFLDVGIMIYCIINGISYSSSLNIFAVIAGIILLKGGLKTARVVSWFAAFLIATFILSLFLVPFIIPLDLLLLELKLSPASIIPLLLTTAIILAIFIWIYRNLTSEPVLVAMDNAEINYKSFWASPVRGFWCGACFVIFVFTIVHSGMNGKTATEVKQRATIQVGKGYKLHIKSISSCNGSKSVYAIVTAYNDTEIKNIVVKWSE